MKTLPCLILALSAALPALALAESQSERELAQLRDQRDKAIAAANDPINRRYQASLEQLLRRAMQSNDLDGAVKIKAAIAEAGVLAAGESNKALQTLMEGSRWTCINIGDDDHWVEFYKGGKCRGNWNKPLEYTIVGPKSLRVMETGLKTWHFTVDLAKKEAVSDPVGGDERGRRVMKFERTLPAAGN